MYDLLRLLEDNARLEIGQIATMLNMTEDEVRAAIREYEQSGVIRGYKTIIDWDKTDRDYVSARIEVKVIPKKDRGFDEIAHTIASLSEVQSVYLMSGGYDLALTVVGKTFQDVASFVAFRLAPLSGVQSTSTHFVLRRYKEKGIVVDGLPEDERGVVL